MDTEPRRDAARIASIAFAGYALAGGLISFAGWFGGAPRLIDWWGTGLTMKTNSAICAISMALAILLLHLAPRMRPLAHACAALAGTIGFLSLLQHLLLVDLGIDTLIFDEAPGSPATVAPNRMGPPASISFTLLALSYWLGARRSHTTLAVPLPFVVLVISLLSVIGYLYGAEAMYTAPRVTGISMQTATMIAALAISLVAAQPAREPVRTLSEISTAGDLARRLMPLAIVVPIFLGFTVVTGQRAGHFDVAFGTALRTVVEILLLSTVLWWAVQVVQMRDQQRRDTEDARYRGERRLRRVLDASAVPFMVLSPERDDADAIVDFRWAYVNKAAADVLGRDGSSVVGARVSELYPDTWSEPGLFEHFSAATMLHAVRDFEVRSIAGGVRGWFHVIVSSLDQDIGVWFSDVSERKRHELELRDADQRKDEFLATLAHELRNPLAPIRMAATLAKRPETPEAQRRWCQDVIERQVQHMSLLLDDLLDVSRITRGILEVRRTPTSLRSLVESAIETARPLIDSKKHRLGIDLHGDAMVDVDPLRMAQMISNLLNNAAKYTPPGGSIRLSVSMEGADLRIAVSDSGIGIGREDLESIFNMFSQVKSAQERSEGGLGIGLALTRGLAELHGGHVTVASEGAGLGSTFTLLLPGVLVAGTGTGDSRALPQRPANALRILIADDNRDAADSLAMLLRSDGHDVVTADDGGAALREFERSAPQAVLLDIGMPRMSGFDVARRIRDSDPAVLLIAITGWGQSGDRAKSAAAGFDHHLTKPVDYRTLAGLLLPASTD